MISAGAHTRGTYLTRAFSPRALPSWGSVLRSMYPLRSWGKPSLRTGETGRRGGGGGVLSE